jgi:malic enzyme
MASDAVVFACANPIPEIWPSEACEAGARIVATGRCDLPNQVNNSLAFPGIFRGVLDVRARKISERMAIAAAPAIAAQDEGLTEFKRTRESVLDEATTKIRAARELAEAIVHAGGMPRTCSVDQTGVETRGRQGVQYLPRLFFAAKLQHHVHDRRAR